MRKIAHDSISASPEALERQLWQVLAGIVCQARHAELTCPCQDCLRLIQPLVAPIAGSFLVSGFRQPNDYSLAGAAVFHLFDMIDATLMGKETKDAVHHLADARTQELPDPEGRSPAGEGSDAG